MKTVRLALLLGLLSTFVAGSVYAAFAIPALFGILPLLVFAAACPAMCVVGRVVAWVRGGNEVEA